MAVYCQEVYLLEDKFNGLELNHIPRRLNEAVDTLAKMASSRQPVPSSIFASNQYKLSIRYDELAKAGAEPLAPDSAARQLTTFSNHEVMDLDLEPAMGPDLPTDWKLPYLNYLLHEVLPTDKIEARQLACRAKFFVIIEGELYKRSHTKILQRCIPIEQGKQLL
ncbi:uncharacterized protein LOC112900550 [Panicum hallii]|uniref:uncharacterized protein LOC112900550 n=1 Tax=Panicum hallii TaxID=206008 RepID=UPI000DF4F08A|nr:uncharacterized protein LOC112900550 [Panicum hallii]